MKAQESKRQRRKAERPAELLEAALEVFAEKGFAAARMDEIAARAGVSKGTAYLYFESKEDLFRALVQDRMLLIFTPLEQAFETYEGSSRELLEMLLARFCIRVLGTKLAALPRLVIAEVGHFPELAEFYRRNVIDRGLGFLSRIIARGQARGEFRPGNPDHFARLFVAPVLLSAIWRACFDRFDDEPFDFAAFIETHRKILLSGLAPEPERGKQ